MKHLGMWFLTICKRLVLQPFLYIGMVLLIVLPIAMKLGTDSEGVSVKVLIKNEASSDDKANELVDKLMGEQGVSGDASDSGNGIIVFEKCDDTDELRERIVRGDAEAAYIIPDGFSEKLNEFLDQGTPVLTAIRSDMETSVRIIDEIVYGKIFDLIAEDVTLNYGESLTGIKNERRDSFIHEKYLEYLGQEMPFEFQHADGSEFKEFTYEDPGKALALTPIVGLIGVLIALIAMTGGILWYSDEGRGVFLHLNGVGKEIVHLFYILIPTLLSVPAGLAVILILTGGEVLWNIFCMLCYVVMIVPAVYIVQKLVRNQFVYMALIPVFTILNLVAGSVFAELSDVAALAWVQKAVPLYHYMNLVLDK